MSIYGGFGTRQQETQYNNLTEALISLLQYRLIAYMKCEKIDEENFRLNILNVYDSMTRMEIRKYLEPKFSDSCKDLIKKIVKEMEEEKKISEVVSERHIFIKQTSPNSLLGEIYFDSELLNSKGKDTEKVLRKVKSKLKVRQKSHLNEGKISKKISKKLFPGSYTMMDQIRSKEDSPELRSKTPILPQKSLLTFQPSLTSRDPTIPKPPSRPKTPDNGFLYARIPKT